MVGIGIILYFRNRATTPSGNGRSVNSVHLQFDMLTKHKTRGACPHGFCAGGKVFAGRPPRQPHPGARSDPFRI